MQYLVLSIIFVLIFLLARSSIRPLYLFGGTLAFFYFIGLISTQNLLHNFVNEGLVTLVLLLLISIVLENTIFIRQNSSLIFYKNRYHFSLFKIISITSFFSAFLNNTAVVAIMMSIIKRQKNEISSKYLLPLSYAAILGGAVTLIGTLTNLIINSFVIGEGMSSLGMFDFAPIGIVLVIGGFMYMLLFSQKLLPKIKVDDTYDQLSYFIEAKVSHKSAMENDLVYIDLNMKLSKDKKLRSDYSYDGLHLNDKGYKIWQEVVEPYCNYPYNQRKSGVGKVSKMDVWVLLL